MASTENLDELLAGLASMGFEFEQCHEALQAGNTNLESAVEWLMERKAHSSTSSSSSMHDENTSTSKDDASNSVRDRLTDDTSAHEPLVTSRVTRSEDARKARERFIEKEREQARTEAKKRKLEEKRARQQILMQIEDDKEFRKSKSGSKDKHGTSDQHPTTSIKDVDKPKKSSTECLLKVRLPNGQVRTGAVSVNMGLVEAVVMVSQHSSFRQQEIDIIQPFPHKIFTLDELEMSLENLGLFPSAIIVVQKRQAMHSAGGSQTQSSSIPQNMPENSNIQQEHACDQHVDESQHQDSIERNSHDNLAHEGQAEIPGNEIMHPPDNNREIPEVPGNEGHPPDNDREMPEVPGNERHPPDNNREMPEVPGNEAHSHDNGREMPEIPGNEMHAPDNDREIPPVPGNEGQPPNNDRVMPELPGNERHPLDIDREMPEVPANARQAPQLAINRGIGRQFHHWPEGGMRLGAVDYNPHAINPVLPSGSPGESAARRREMREHRLQHLIGADETPPETPHLHREVRRLEDICINDIALRISGHPRLQPIASLGTLSNNICDKILEQLMKNKALTSKTMNAFLSCSLRYLKLDCYLLVTNELLATLRWHKHLTLLSLKSCPLITDKAMEVVTVLKKLQSLNINQCSQLTDKSFIYIKELPSLTVLQMDSTKVTDEGVSYFVSHASCAATLVHLNLSSTPITDSSLEVIKNLKSLKVLEIENTKITKLDALSEMTRLERLNVSHTQLTDDSIAAIRHHSSLKSLNLLSTNITDNGLQQLQSLQLMSLKLPNRLTITDHGLYHIKGLPLTALDISDYINITDLGIHYVSTIHSLTKLSSSNTRLTDSGLRSLSGLVDLVELNLDRTMVTDDGCAVIQNFQNLQILSLSSTHITNKMLLNGVLNNCIKLSQLNLSRTSVSNKGISCLNLPSLTLLNLDWTRVTPDCQILFTGCPCLKALRTNNCSPPSVDSEDEED